MSQVEYEQRIFPLALLAALFYTPNVKMVGRLKMQDKTLTDNINSRTGHCAAVIRYDRDKPVWTAR